MAGRMRPALQSFVETFVGGNYVATVTQVTVTTTPSRVMQNDMERMAATIINTGTTDVRLLPDIGVSTVKGVVLAQGGGNMSLVANEDLTLVGYDWWAVVSAGSTTLEVITTTRYNPGAS